MSSTVENIDISDSEYYRLRKALLGRDITIIDEANRQLNDPEAFAKRLTDNLNEAVIACDAQSNKFSYGLRDPLLKSLAVAAQTKPDELSKSLAPIIGKAVMSAVSEAMRGVNEQIESAFTKAFTTKGLKWRFQSWRTGEPYARIALLATHSFQIQQVAYLSKRHGKLLARFVGKAVLEERQTSGGEMQIELLESLAMNMQMTNKAHEIKPIDSGATQIYMAHGPWSALAVVCWGKPPEDLNNKILALLLDLERNYADDLKRFKSDASPFEPVIPELSNLLNSYIQKPNKRSSDVEKKGFSWLTWLFILALLALLLAVFYYNPKQEKTIIANLEKQQGFILSSITGNFITGWHINGLADPLGFNENTMKAKTGIDPDKLTFTLKPFLSLEPDLILTRAKLKLNPPNAVSLMFDEKNKNQINAIGSASQAWIDSAKTKTDGLIGIEQVSFDKIKLTDIIVTPAALPDPSNLIAQLGQVQIDFSSDNILAADQTDTLKLLADLITQLSQIAEARQEMLSIHLTGHTTSDGASAQKNNELREARAKTVVIELVTLGVDANKLVINASDESQDTKAVSVKATLDK